ncbi:MAG: RHS repeat protein [Bacteroidales bacterium]|nr:RHS repeat protein [Bacteroidales bacterium]
MKTINKLFYLILLSISIIQYSYAQLTLVNEPDKPSVQASEMTRYGKLTPQLYTGKVSVTVPIYTYRNSRFTLPISLDYSYNGLIPNRQTGILGLGWTLSCAGSITREVRGIPDELQGSFNYSTSTSWSARDVLGFDYLPVVSYLPMPTYEVVNRPTPGNVLKTAYELEGPNNLMTLYETTPDIYHFSFPGHSGSFYRNTDGSFTVFHTSSFDGNYKIEKINTPYGDGSGNVSSQFIITTSDGYRYIFGGDDTQSQGTERKFNFIERNIPQGFDKENPEAHTPYRATAFLLNTIESPDGASASFRYNTHDGYSDIVSYSTNLWLSWETNEDPVSMLQYNEEHNTASYLSSIDFSNGESIEFTYLSKPNGKQGSYMNGSQRRDMNATHSYLLLDSIKTPAGSMGISYTFNAMGNTYPFISSVNIEQVGRYTFDYEGLEESFFPAFGTTATDHWGFLNRNDSTNMNHNTISLNQLGTQEPNSFDETVSSYRNANSGCSSIGIMKKITYPTGGSTELVYESNTVRRNLRKKSSNFFSPTMDASSPGFLATGPGSRISQIINIDENGIPTDTTSYRYTLAASSTTSGSLLVYPRYVLNYSGYLTNHTIYVQLASSSGISNYEATPVEYSRVEEILPDKSKVVHFFTDWDDYPDDIVEGDFMSILHSYNDGFQNQASYMQIRGANGTGSGATAVHNILCPTSSQQHKRGREKKSEIYNSEGNLLHSSQTTFAVEEGKPAFYESIYVGEAIAQIQRQTAQFRPSQTSEKDFFNSGEPTSYVSSTYNSNGQKIQETKTLSNGDIITTSYIFISEIPAAARTAVQQAMITANRITSPVRVTVKVRQHDSQQEKIISCDSLTFSAIAGTENRTLYLPTQWLKRNVNDGSWKVYATYSYDSQGNIIQKTDANAISTTFIWYNNNKGVAMRIDNATNEQITNILGSTCFSSTTEENVEARAASIKNAIPQCEVSWYKWHAYGLPAQVTDPTGRVTHYTYDQAQRLNYILDEDLNPLERYYYQTVTR